MFFFAITLNQISKHLDLTANPGSWLQLPGNECQGKTAGGLEGCGPCKVVFPSLNISSILAAVSIWEAEREDGNFLRVSQEAQMHVSKSLAYNFTQVYKLLTSCLIFFTIYMYVLAWMRFYL